MFIFSLILTLICLTIATFVVHTQAEGYYTITSPGNVRPNSNYTVYVRVTDVEENTKIQLCLKGTIPEQIKTLDVLPNSPNRVTFELGEIPKGEYKLEARGLAGIIFQNAKNLEFVENVPLVYIQTDKALYRQSEIINFRVIFLDQYLLPAKINQPISVVIKDADGNRIERFDDTKLNVGVFKEKLKLAESVIWGAWHLETYIGADLIAEKVVEVKEYQLPLFELVVEAPDYVSFNEKTFPVKVRAAYTYGKPVTGNCVINFISKERAVNEVKDPLEDGRLEKMIDLKQFGKKLQNINVTVTVEDSVMRMSRTVSKTVSISRKRYDIDAPTIKVECDGPSDTFIYRGHISQLNGAPIDVDEEISIGLEDGGEEEQPTFITNADNEGYVETEIICANYANYNVTIEYRGQKAVGSIELYHRGDGGKGGVYVKTQFPKVDSPIEVRLVSSEEFSSFAYVIVGRGNIIYDDIVGVPGEASYRTYTFTFTATYEMMPKAHIFVYFFKNGKMHYYEATFTVEKQFQNCISIDAPETAKPGSYVSIDVETDPQSYVGLLGMDKSVLLLKSGNDFDAEVIFKDLEKIQNKTPQSYLSTNGTYPGENSGLVTMTNAQPSGELIQSDPHINKRRLELPRRVRRNFFETFAFFDFVSADGQDNVIQKIPDTITSWVITGFSINPKTGFTLTTKPTVVRTFLEFFVAVNLPLSVKVGETLTLPVVIFNYLHTDTKANVIMETKNDEFEFVGNPAFKSDTIHTFVNKGKSETVFFAIRPKVAGMITLKITAESPLASDVIIKKLRVEYEGITEWNNVDIYLDGEEKQAIKLEIPEDSVPGSEHIDISVMDYVLYSMVNLVNSGENFDQLIRSPTGCGEQNMIHSVANLMTLKYLESTKSTNQPLYNKAKTNLQTGYQREFNYKLPDGSFSTWGRKPGITWLTAYVVRIFNEAKSYIYVDDEMITRALDFLASKQEPDGSFREDGKLTDFANLNKLSITASVLYAFLENTQHSEKFIDIVNKGLDYVRRNVKENNDIRAVALSMYVLQKCKDQMAKEILTQLEAKAKTTEDHKWWQLEEKPRNNDIHITGYILMTMIELKKPVTPIVKWLVSKRNSNGGFVSTFETEVGLRALSNYAASYNEVGKNLKVNVETKGKLLHAFTLGDESEDLNKNIEVPNDVRELYLTSVGNGKATFQVACRYNTVKPESETFIVNSSISESEPTSSSMKVIQICIQSTQYVQTNMAVMEFALPSGDEIGPDCCNLTNAKFAQSIKRAQSNKVDIYFDGFTKSDSECFYVPTVTVHNVTDQKAGSIIMYDYYNKESTDKYYYDIKK
ncbi:CD109 antigen-like [Eurosta solidaginis]|uniref:CD109 antigen-like n=1 Tax=Eurosta solidaginis TaxID=178769 RepID=UPI0035317913